MKKKSLIENLKTTRKANIISKAAKNEGTSTRKSAGRRLTIVKGGAKM